MIRFILTCALSLTVLSSVAQGLRDSVFILPDTAQAFTLANFYDLILRNHPVARQASLLPEVAQQEIRYARGQFDPSLQAEYRLKQYDSEEYYRTFNGSLDLPTRSPITPTIGLERNTGQHVAAEKYISDRYDYRQVYAGISIPLGRGLMTDERRTALRQAELFSEMMEAEQVSTINQLLLEAAKDYWAWYHSYYNFRLASGTQRVAEAILALTKANLEGGEAASVDTVQARITLLERQVARQEAFTDYLYTSIAVSTHLWDSLMNPVELSVRHAPVNSSDLLIPDHASLEALVEQAKANHPALRKLKTKLQQLDNERRLASEFLKPKLELSYFMLDQPLSPEGIAGNFTFSENYKLGVDFAIPLFLRKERAKVAQTRIKLSAMKYDQHLTARQIINDIQAAYNQLLNNAAVMRQQREMVNHYYRLLNAELVNLQNGESDLFRINVQQEKLFSAQSKLIKVIAAYEEQKALLQWSAGMQPSP